MNVSQPPFRRIPLAQPISNGHSAGWLQEEEPQQQVQGFGMHRLGSMPGQSAPGDAVKQEAKVPRHTDPKHPLTHTQHHLQHEGRDAMPRDEMQEETEAGAGGGATGMAMPAAPLHGMYLPHAGLLGAQATLVPGAAAAATPMATTLTPALLLQQLQALSMQLQVLGSAVQVLMQQAAPMLATMQQQGLTQAGLSAADPSYQLLLLQQQQQQQAAVMAQQQAALLRSAGLGAAGQAGLAMPLAGGLMSAAALTPAGYAALASPVALGTHQEGAEQGAEQQQQEQVDGDRRSGAVVAPGRTASGRPPLSTSTPASDGDVSGLLPISRLRGLLKQQQQQQQQQPNLSQPGKGVSGRDVGTIRGRSDGARGGADGSVLLEAAEALLSASEDMAAAAAAEQDHQLPSHRPGISPLPRRSGTHAPPSGVRPGQQQQQQQRVAASLPASKPPASSPATAKYDLGLSPDVQRASAASQRAPAAAGRPRAPSGAVDGSSIRHSPMLGSSRRSEPGLEALPGDAEARKGSGSLEGGEDPADAMLAAAAAARRQGSPYRLVSASLPISNGNKRARSVDGSDGDRPEQQADDMAPLAKAPRTSPVHALLSDSAVQEPTSTEDEPAGNGNGILGSSLRAAMRRQLQMSRADAEAGANTDAVEAGAMARASSDPIATTKDGTDPLIKLAALVPARASPPLSTCGATTPAPRAPSSNGAPGAALSGAGGGLDDDSAAEDLDGDDGMGGAGDGDDLVMDVGEGGERVLILRRPQSGAQQRKITLKMLQEVYHLPIHEAAQSLGVGVTVLKKYCRRFDVGRWPYRKLQSLEKLIKSVEEQAAADPLVDVSFTLSELQRFKTEVYTNPEVILDERIKKLRQANFKQEYKQRRATGGPVPLTALPTLQQLETRISSGAGISTRSNSAAATLFQMSGAAAAAPFTPAAAPPGLAPTPGGLFTAAAPPPGSLTGPQAVPKLPNALKPVGPRSSGADTGEGRPPAPPAFPGIPSTGKGPNGLARTGPWQAMVGAGAAQANKAQVGRINPGINPQGIASALIALVRAQQQAKAKSAAAGSGAGDTGAGGEGGLGGVGGEEGGPPVTTPAASPPCQEQEQPQVVQLPFPDPVARTEAGRDAPLQPQEGARPQPGSEAPAGDMQHHQAHKEGQLQREGAETNAESWRGGDLEAGSMVPTVEQPNLQEQGADLRGGARQYTSVAHTEQGLHSLSDAVLASGPSRAIVTSISAG